MTANLSAVPSLAHALHKGALSQSQRKPTEEMYGFERFWTVLYEFVRNGTFLNFFSARMIKGEFAVLPIEISSCKGKGGPVESEPLLSLHKTRRGDA